MSTVTYTLTNGETITFKWDDLNPTEFFEKIIDVGEELDIGRIPNIEVKSIHISYQFPKSTMIIKD